jgi:hypothetical protein
VVTIESAWRNLCWQASGISGIVLFLLADAVWQGLVFAGQATQLAVHSRFRLASTVDQFCNVSKTLYLLKDMNL